MLLYFFIIITCIIAFIRTLLSEQNVNFLNRWIMYLFVQFNSMFYLNTFFCSVVCETRPSSLYRSGEVEIYVGGGKRGVSTKAVRFTYRVSYEPTLPSMHCTHINPYTRPYTLLNSPPSFRT